VLDNNIIFHYDATSIEEAKMNTLLNALKEETNVAFTENGAVSYASTLNPILDFFVTAPASFKDVEKGVTIFKLAYAADRRTALRILLWVRDIRGGAGARAIYRACLAWLSVDAPKDAIRMLDRTVLVGRWDDVISVLSEPRRDNSVYEHVIALVRDSLQKNDFLCAKWMPRKGPLAAILALSLQKTPKQWRKTLVNICSKNFLVETEMCSNQWNSIPYENVPSVAFARYKSAFKRHDMNGYSKFLGAVKSGEKTINAGAIFPHDIVRDCKSAGADEQWKQLPCYLEGEDTGIVVADVSGSMASSVSGSITNLHVAISLAIYMAERARGPFKDHFITFSERATMVHIPSTLSLAEKVKIAQNSQWDMNTDIQSVFNLLLDTAKKNKVEQKDMPKFVTIISDMQFDQCGKHTNLDVIRTKYSEAGYKMPKLVFWNVAAYGDKPATMKDLDTILIGGFSPAILQNVFKQGVSSPMEIFLNTVLNPRYDFEGCTVKVKNEV
jgi:hypothetical protein